MERRGLPSDLAPLWRVTLIVHAGRGDRDSVETAIQRLEERETESPNLRSAILWAQGRLAEVEDGNCVRAIGFYDQVAEMTESPIVSFGRRLHCAIELERRQLAEELSAFGLGHFPGTAKVRLRAALYHAARDERDLALEHVDRVLEIWGAADPDYGPAEEARILRARLLSC